VHRLVALDLPGGPAFVAALRRAWDAGDAVVVVDPRLPEAARRRLLDATRPHAVVGPGGEERTSDAAAPPMDEGDALVATTSGSTGEPKAVVHTHASLLTHARAVHQRLGIDPATDRWLACLPLAHLGGFGVVARALLTATPFDVVAGFDADEVAAAPRRLGTTLVSLVATALDRVDPSPFRWVVLGGSADPTGRPANVVHTYGLTETGGGVVYEGVPLDGVEVAIADGGAIAVRSATIARGRRRPDGSVEPLTDPAGWLHTGDLGRWGPDGRLVVEGRADELIVTGGENVWPGPVEAALATHPGVREVAVIGEPDPEWGQRVVAVVVATDPGAPPTLEGLRAHARAELPGPWLPRALRLVDRLPRTALGKVARAALEAAPDQ
jgi:O-succinylbenzoic acid--CoA ligase